MAAFVYLVVKPEEADGVYVFDDAGQRDRFFAACGGEGDNPQNAYKTDEPVIDAKGAELLVRAEAGPGDARAGMNLEEARLLGRHLRSSTPTEQRWVARRRREAGVAPDEQSCWFAWLEQGDDRALVSLGRSPGDVLFDAELYAAARYGHQEGTGRWLVDNRAGEQEEGVYSTYLVVRAELDEQIDEAAA